MSISNLQPDNVFKFMKHNIKHSSESRAERYTSSRSQDKINLKSFATKEIKETIIYMRKKCIFG